MAAKKKAVNLSELPFSELRDKAKEIEGFKTMSRYEMTAALLQAESRPGPAGADPRSIKPEIKSLSAQLETAEGRQARRDLRRAKARLKRATRRYL